jgi:hypothetical protein
VWSLARQRGVTMPTKYLWKLLLGLVIVSIIGGCTSLTEGKSEANNGVEASEGPTLSLIIGGHELLTRPTDTLLSGSYRKGITILELLRGSDIATFAEGSHSILSVRDFSLAPELEWELKVDGKTIGDENWDSKVGHDSHLVFTAKSGTHPEPLQTVMMTVDGRSEQVDINHSYVVLFTEDLSVRSLLKSCNQVQLTEDNRKVLSVNDYIPLSNEVWKLKVNGKQLLDSGMDMKLSPQDELEIVLTSR